MAPSGSNFFKNLWSDAAQPKTRRRKTRGEKKAAREIRRGVVPDTAGWVSEDRPSKANLVGIVIPSMFGKTTTANKLGWIDVDDLITQEGRAQSMADFGSKYLSGGWIRAMDEYNRMCERALSLLTFSEATVILGHSVSSLVAIGVAPAMRIIPSQKFFDRVVPTMDKDEEAFALANYNAVRLEDDSSPLVVVDSYETAGAVLAATTEKIGQKLGKTYVDRDTIIADYNGGKITRVDADVYMRELGRPYKGFGRLAGSWARAVSHVGTQRLRPTKEQTPITPNLLNKAMAVDPELTKMVVGAKQFEPQTHVEQCLLLIISMEDLPDFREVVGSLLCTPLNCWVKVMRQVSTLARSSDNYLGFTLCGKERKMMSELWLLGNRHLRELDQLVMDRLHGCGGTYKPEPSTADVLDSMVWVGLKESGGTVREELTRRLRKWVGSWDVADSAGIDAINSASEALTEGKTPWHRTCGEVYHSVKSKEIGAWLFRLVKICQDDVVKVLWRERIEAALSKLLCYVLAAKASRTQLMKYSVPVMCCDDEAIAAAILSMGLRLEDKGDIGWASQGATAVAETVSCLESRVILVAEVAHTVASVERDKDLVANLWHRARASDLSGLTWILRREFDDNKDKVSDSHIRRYIEHACTPKARGGRGLMSARGETFSPSNGGGLWVQVPSSGGRVRAVLNTRKAGTSLSVGDAKRSGNAMSFGLIGSCLTKGMDREVLGLVVGRIASTKRKQITFDGAVPETWELEDLINDTLREALTVL
ncbi:unknown [Verticillium dahliae chrysovirus 1]|uniref:Uncharacterized protein n=1 Tax=Verticillium dahliae chrysovirus 1 TaxID=759389 RepID=D6QSQ5_9VIRU|nr:unknown [Verticillium dahliae chrysovirus 1]ADG21215.2 unknown [Verticillium dahliae chrysovirus 1]